MTHLETVAGSLPNLSDSHLLFKSRSASTTRILFNFAMTKYSYLMANVLKINEVKALRLYSKKDNKMYEVELPSAEEIKEFEEIISKFRTFTFEEEFSQSPKKCQNCIYAALCDKCSV